MYDIALCHDFPYYAMSRNAMHMPCICHAMQSRANKANAEEQRLDSWNGASRKIHFSLLGIFIFLPACLERSTCGEDVYAEADEGDSHIFQPFSWAWAEMWRYDRYESTIKPSQAKQHGLAKCFFSCSSVVPWLLLFLLCFLLLFFFSYLFFFGFFCN